MDPEFGIGVKRFLFEFNDARTGAILEEKIYSQVSKYMPFIKIQKVQVRSNNNKLYLSIVYLIDKLQVLDSVEISSEW